MTKFNRAYDVGENGKDALFQGTLTAQPAALDTEVATLGQAKALSAETAGAVADLQKQMANINGLYSAFESVSRAGAATDFPSQEEMSSAPYVRATSLEGLKELQLLPWG